MHDAITIAYSTLMDYREYSEGMLKLPVQRPTENTYQNWCDFDRASSL